MKKSTALGLYLLTLLLTISLVFGLNALTPQLTPDDTLPSDIDHQVYALPLDQKAHHLRYHLPDNNDTLMLFTSNQSAIRRVSSFKSETDQYRHVYSIPLRQAADAQGVAEIIIGESNRSSSFLIGSAQIIERHFWFVESLSYLLVGLHVMLILFVFCLYINKRSEKYLLTLLSLAFLSAFSFILVLPDPILPFSSSSTYYLNYVSTTVPLYIHFALCLSLMDWRKTRLIRALSSPKNTFRIVTLLFISGFVMSDYQTLAAAFIRWGTTTLVAALILLYAQSIRSVLLLLGFVFSNGVGIGVNLIKDLHFAPLGEIIVLMRLSHFSRTAFLCLAAADTALRFSSKFAEAEQLGTELNALNASLDRQVAERTAELVRKDEQKHQFMLNIFHDLRSPILIARNCIESLQSGRDTTESLSILDNSVDFMSRMTEDLFLSAQLEDNQLFLAMDKLNLSDFCNELAQGYAMRTKEKSIAFKSEIESGIHIWGDELRIRQVIENLLGNALQYTPFGGTIALRLSANEKSCLIEVKNSGIGIPPKKLPYIFERYYSYARSSNRHSTGLGLSIARDLVTLHQGSITVKSVPDEYTVFVVELPLLQIPVRL